MLHIFDDRVLVTCCLCSFRDPAFEICLGRRFVKRHLIKKLLFWSHFFNIWYEKNCFERNSRHLIRKMLSPLLKDQFPQDLHERSWEVFGETCFQLDIYSPYWLFSRSRKKHDFFIFSGLDIFHTDFSHVLEKRIPHFYFQSDKFTTLAFHTFKKKEKHLQEGRGKHFEEKTHVYKKNNHF